MEARKCKYCAGTIPTDKRADSKFCSNSCKASHWEKSKEKNKIPYANAVAEKMQPKVAEMPLEGLRGVIENKPETDVLDVKKTSKQPETSQLTPVILRSQTQAYKNALAQKDKAESDFQRVKKLHEACVTNLKNWQIIQEKLKYTKPVKKHVVMNIDVMALQDDLLLDDAPEYKPDFHKQKVAQENINILAPIKSKLERMLPAVNKIYEEAILKIRLTPRYETEKPNPVAPPLELSARQMQMPDAKQYCEQPTITQGKDEPVERAVVVQSNGKLISSCELREMNYKCLNFQDRWKEFFGLPAVVFHLAVHGKPGEGKSTFCIQFADYLAKSFGNVVYISGEEGFSKTLRDKVVNNKIDNPYLFFADISSFEQIKSEIENNKFHFIFIDSLDTLRIDAVRLRMLREYYPQSAFITISQSTKDGKMRGSQEIIHDADITVKVENGIAMTTKNRFHPRGTEFQVFPTTETATSKMIDEPRNII